MDLSAFRSLSLFKWRSASADPHTRRADVATLPTDRHTVTDDGSTRLHSMWPTIDKVY
jgi:hypothetical protein